MMTSLPEIRRHGHKDEVLKTVLPKHHVTVGAGSKDGLGLPTAALHFTRAFLQVMGDPTYCQPYFKGSALYLRFGDSIGDGLKITHDLRGRGRINVSRMEGEKFRLPKNWKRQEFALVLNAPEKTATLSGFVRHEMTVDAGDPAKRFKRNAQEENIPTQAPAPIPAAPIPRFDPVADVDHANLKLLIADVNAMAELLGDIVFSVVDGKVVAKRRVVQELDL